MHRHGKWLMGSVTEEAGLRVSEYLGLRVQDFGFPVPAPVLPSGYPDR